MTSTTINAASTMQEVLAAYPGAQRGLFTRYHIGGCGSCGYQPTDTLEQVAQKHNIRDVDQVVAYIQRDEADAVDQNLQVQPVEVAAVLKDGPFLAGGRPHARGMGVGTHSRRDTHHGGISP